MPNTTNIWRKVYFQMWEVANLQLYKMGYSIRFKLTKMASFRNPPYKGRIEIGLSDTVLNPKMFLLDIRSIRATCY